MNLIVARAGSKGVPGKNLLPIGGLSLVGYKAIAARKSQQCTRLVISSESKEIQSEAARFGVEVLFDRPEMLASDSASTNDVIMHAIEWFEENTSDHYDAIMLLEPSSPFATHVDLDAAVQLFKQKSASAVVGVREMEVSSYYVGAMDENKNLSQIMQKIVKLKSLRRQDLKSEFTMNGALYLFGWDYFKKHKNIYADINGVYGYQMAREYSVEIDEPIDFALAGLMVDTGKVDKSYWRVT